MDSRCSIRACPYPAIKGSTLCVNHAPAKDSIPQTITSKEYEIVTMEAVPKFKVMNEKSYNIARVISSLTEGHALKVACNGKATSFAASICNYCGKMGFRVRHRKTPGFIFFWKADKSKPAARSIA